MIEVKRPSFMPTRVVDSLCPLLLIVFMKNQTHVLCPVLEHVHPRGCGTYAHPVNGLQTKKIIQSHLFSLFSLTTSLEKSQCMNVVGLYYCAFVTHVASLIVR